ncbi:MAG: putative sulfate/molybdate transporter, partial [Fimbriimonadales bacterium]|nr:putative sulfate/molybdate transporter [Fimbriimonadales bacterium]
TQKTSAPLILGAGMAIGFAMFLLTLLGALKGLARLVPKPVIRGIQAGLGLQLAIIALKEFIGTGPALNFVLGGIGAIVVLALKNNRKMPASLLIVGAGIILTLATLGRQGTTLFPALAIPVPHPPTLNDIALGFLLLGLPQLPLSLANSILATHQLIKDYFPERPLSINKIGLTYALMNLISSPLGGIPVCHGSGGMAGHYTFGARTGGSVVIYGSVFLLL